MSCCLVYGFDRIFYPRTFCSKTQKTHIVWEIKPSEANLVSFVRGPITSQSQSDGLDYDRRPPSEEGIVERGRQSAALVSTPRFILMAVPLGIWSSPGADDHGLPTLV